MQKENIVVSVCMITFNHENFIREAIEGVLMQKTDFPVELIIGEDCSTDSTRKICLEYKAKYPDKIRLLLPEFNLGVMRNFIETMQAATGKYIALCEGDDYWTDPYKLQKQVDFLEKNEEYSICFHPVKVWKENEKDLVNDFITHEVSETTTILDLAEGNYIHTPSVVFRINQEVFETFNSMGGLPAGDYVLHMLNAKYGKIEKLPEIMGVYRYGVGVWSKSYTIKNDLEWLIMLHKLEMLMQDNLNVSRILYKQIDKYKTSIVNQYNGLYNEIDQLKNSKSYFIGKLILKPVLFCKYLCNFFR